MNALLAAAEPKVRRAAREEDPSRRFALRKSEILRMLMAMDRYNTDSVLIRAGDGSFNWEIPTSKPKPRRKPVSDL